MDASAVTRRVHPRRPLYAWRRGSDVASCPSGSTGPMVCAHRARAAGTAPYEKNDERKSSQSQAGRALVGVSGHVRSNISGFVGAGREPQPLPHHRSARGAAARAAGTPTTAGIATMIHVTTPHRALRGPGHRTLRGPGPVTPCSERSPRSDSPHAWTATRRRRRVSTVPARRRRQHAGQREEGMTKGRPADAGRPFEGSATAVR